MPEPDRGLEVEPILPDDVLSPVVPELHVPDLLSFDQEPDSDVAWEPDFDQPPMDVWP